MRRLFIALLAGLAAGPTLAASVDSASVISKLDPAWQELENKTAKLIGRDSQHAMVDMAYAEVAIDACPGLTANKAAFDKGFEGLSSDPLKKRKPEEQRPFEHQVMAFFGVYTGLILSESFIDRDAFCKDVAGVQSRKGGPSQYWVAK